MLDLISAYENYLTKVKQASNNTITSYMRDIRQFAGWLSTTEELDTVDATQENISRYMEVLEEEGRSTATQARCVASLRNFYSYLVSSGFLEQSPVTDVKVERKERKLPQILTNREIELLLSQPVCIDDKGFRDKAMLEVLYATGMRVSELIDLNVSDVNLDQGIVKCTTSRKTRSIPLYPAAQKALRVYFFGNIFAGFRYNFVVVFMSPICVFLFQTLLTCGGQSSVFVMETANAPFLTENTMMIHLIQLDHLLIQMRLDLVYKQYKHPSLPQQHRFSARIASSKVYGFRLYLQG